MKLTFQLFENHFLINLTSSTKSLPLFREIYQTEAKATTFNRFARLMNT